jgi:diguanylate cyclase (GGDEF)-like protein
MILPAVVLTGTFFLVHKAVVESLDEVVEEAKDEMHPVMTLQKLLLDVTMPPHDYLLFGDTSERENYEIIIRAIDKAFEEALIAPFGLTEEQELIHSSYSEWEETKELGNTLMALSPDERNKTGLELMERFDLRINHSVEILERVHGVIMKEMGEHLDRAETIKDRMFLLIALLMIIWLGMAMVAGIRLPRSILSPLRIFEKATKRLADGELDSRVPLKSKDELGKLAKAFNIMAARLEKSQKALEEMASHDSLTEVYNRGEFYRRLNSEIQRSKRYGHVFSMLLTDIDYFKEINDTYGHQVGDKVLQDIAAVIQKQVRPEDVVARYGGDEFVLILPETPIANALKLAERIRGAIAAHTIHLTEKLTTNLTVSIGAADFPKDGKTADKLIAASDHSLYASKHFGRNRVYYSSRSSS